MRLRLFSHRVISEITSLLLVSAISEASAANILKENNPKNLTQINQNNQFFLNSTKNEEIYQKIKKTLKKTSKLIQSDKLKESLKALDKIHKFIKKQKTIVKKNKELYSNWYYLRAFLFEKEKKIHKALRYYRKSWKIYPQKAETALKISLIYYKLNQNYTAQKYLNKALKLSPNNKNVLALKRAMETRYMEAIKRSTIIGLRTVYLKPFAGGMEQYLSQGFGINLFYTISMDFFFGHFFCGELDSFFHHFFDSIQIMVNFERLGNKDTYLMDIGFELGPRWSLSLAKNHSLSFNVLAGFMYETAKNSNVSPALESSNIQLSGHIIVTYELHFLKTVLSVSSYNSFSLDQDMPLYNLGFSMGIGYRLFTIANSNKLKDISLKKQSYEQ